MNPPAHAALRAALALTVFLAPWPGFGHAFAAGYSRVLNVFSGIMAGKGRFEFSPEGPASSWNALLRLENAAGTFAVASWDLRRVPYLPLAVFVALSLALPIRSRARRLWLLGVGLAILQVPALLRLVLVLTAPPLTVLELSGWARDLVFTACTALVFPPVMAFALPVFAFLALAWRLEPEALTALRERKASPRTAPVSRLRVRSRARRRRRTRLRT